MTTSWRFDDSSPYEDVFEEGVLKALSSPLAFDALRRTLLEIQQDPLAGVREIVDGQIIYIVRAPAVTAHGVSSPPLLLAYTLDHRRRLIQRVALVLPPDIADEPGAEWERTLASFARPGIERALKRAAPDIGQPTERILFPNDRTTIEEDTLEEAVRRTRQRWH